MAFQPQYEGIDNFNFLQSRTRTGSADQGFYDDDPANPLEFTQYLPTSLMDGRISDEVPQRSPVFCDACGYTLESLEENCLWCQFTNDEVTGAIEYPPAEAQADLPDTHENQWNDTPVEASVARQPRSPGDPYLGDFAMDPNIDPTTLGFEELPTFLWPSAEDVDVYQRWFQRVVDDGLPAGFPDLARHGHNEEGLPENQAPLPLERVLDQEFNEVNVRVPRRRRLFPEERLEVAAKRGKVCASCRRKKIKVRPVQILSLRLADFWVSSASTYGLREGPWGPLRGQPLPSPKY